MDSLDRLVIAEHEVPERMSWKLAEQWAAIPAFDKQDTINPEWPKSPIIRINVEGFEEIYVMNEGDRRVNPQGVAKNRAAWEITGIYRDYARLLLEQQGTLNGGISNLSVPRFTLLTSLNAGHALASTFGKYKLPPPKLLISDKKIEQARVLTTIADIYATDLNREELSGEQISLFTNSVGGVDLTSVMIIEPQSTFYDWGSHYALNEGAKNVFVPDGSGRFRENLQTWQHRNVRSLARGYRADNRLELTDVAILASMSIVGIKPERKNSAADKLTCKYNPFAAYNDADHAAGRSLGFTGALTGSYAVPEEFLAEGYRLLKDLIPVEFSGAAGLGGLLYFAEKGWVSRFEKHLIINTGKGDFVE